jgi:hypothetical protein
MSALLLGVCFYTATAQQNNTVYFMRGIEERNIYNPAFQPESNVYIDWLILPNFKFNLGLPVTLNDMFFTKDGKTLSFLDVNAGEKRGDFYNALKNNVGFDTDFSLNLLGFGFRVKKNYFTFDITQKMNGGAYLPKDLFSFALYGTEKSNTFDLGKLGVQASLYTEVGLGFSRQLNEKLTVGAKLKYLIGQANIHTDFDDFKLTTNRDKWEISGQGSLNLSLPFTHIPFKEEVNGLVMDFDNIDFNDDLKSSDIINAMLTSNSGWGLDLGVTYQLLPKLQLSAAVTDLGFIRWKKNLTNAQLNAGYSFTGVEYNLDDDLTMGDLFDNQLDSLKNSFVFSKSNKAYTTSLSTRLNVGAEYSIMNDKIGFGLLSSTLFVNKTAYSDLTASVNFRPSSWFNPSISYSVLNGAWSSLGLGAQLKLGMFNMYFAVDQIPLRYTKTKDIPFIPTHLKSMNVQVGMVWSFGGVKRSGF